LVEEDHPAVGLFPNFIVEIIYVCDILIIEMKTRGDCGKDCLNCGLFRVHCPGCITRVCLVAKCKRGISYTGITHPKEICRLCRYCTSTDVIPKGLKIEAMPELKVRTKVEFPRFVPVVRLTDERSWFWNDLPLPWIVVRLAELVKDKALMQSVSSRGLHEFLGFNGKILLSTVMEDELLDELMPKDYVRMINDIRPDATMTPDSYTYIDDPLCLSWEQTLKQATFSRAFSELDIPVVGVIKGVIWKQIAWSVERAIELGCSSFAIPSRELAELGLLDGVISAVTNVLQKSKMDAQLLLYGLSYPFRSKGEFVYSGLSWFIGAKNGYYYKGGSAYLLTDTSIKIEKCHCATCKGRVAPELKDDIRSLALHNLLQTVGRFE